MAISQIFLNVIPAFFALAPEEETALSSIPAYEYRKNGKLHEAVVLTVIGSFGTMLAMMVLLPILIKIIPGIYRVVQPYIGILLLEISVFFVVRKKGKKTLAASIFLLSGVLGILTLNLPMDEPLLPLFSGLFGIPMVLLGLKNETSTSAQETSTPRLSMQISVAILLALMSGVIFSILPGLGPSQAAMIGGQAIQQSKEQMLVLLGGVNSVNMVMSIVTAYTISKERNGAVVAIAELLDGIDRQQFLMLVATSLIAASMAAIATLFVSRWCVKTITNIKYKWIGLTIIGGTIGLVIWLSSWIGMLVFLTGASIGVLTNSWNVQRNQMMGCLILPMILFFML